MVMSASRETLISARTADNHRRAWAARRAAALTLIAVLAGTAAGCGRERATAPARRSIPVDVFADTGRAGRLAVKPPATSASVWMDRVSQTRVAPAGALSTPEPEAPPETLRSDVAPARGLAVDEDLKPPIPRERGALVVPPHAPSGSVELDVRVDEAGRVSDAIWAAGSEDSTLVRAATDCALAMRFFPALQAGRPVAVWCRQRFEFGRAAHE
jgi:TonB family protein